MNLANVRALVEGHLANSPSITAFEEVHYEASKIRRGDLFVAITHEEIDEAISNGAYGVLFDKPTQISDQEIAWIKVDDVENALLRLLRFHVMQKSPQAFYCDEISLKLASQIITGRDLLVLDKTLKEHIQALYQIQENQLILFSKNTIDEQLFIDAKPISKVFSSEIIIVEQTLFETSFIYNDTYYERQLLSPFFISYLESILHFFKQNKVSFQLRNFTPINHFQAVFTNIHFQVKDFGKSDNVLIFESDFKLVKEQIQFLKAKANWAKILYIVPSSKINQLEKSEDIFAYDSTWDIMHILKSQNYHFALIAEQNADILNDSVFDLKNEQLSLF
ncbi:hypothetical protein JHD50_08800 [Sulfurimonas sp. MAG313]|nr:hypothetical protein [Sulfurimonas sp. MAG313]MDF1881395.1 hypothetical protein [Sulfurimonas sp. MAG313]